MPSIQDLLSDFEAKDTALEKTASAASESCSEKEIEQAAEQLGLMSNDEGQTKVASQEPGGENMNLTDLYEAYFGEEGEEKTAAAEGATEDVELTDEEFEKVAAAELESAGEQAGMAFSRSLEDRLIKFAMNQEMESAATEARSPDASVLPGNQPVASPQLEQNKPADAKAGKPMDLTPQHYSLLDKAVAKATLLKALETNNTDGVEGVSQTDVIGEQNSVSSQKDA